MLVNRESSEVKERGETSGRCKILCPRVRKSKAIVTIGTFVVVFAASTALADPSTDYILNCRGCHAPDGGGVAGGAPTFRGQVGQFLSVSGGREYLIRVPGTAQSELSDARIAALLNWIVREFSPAEVPADFVPYTAEEVARCRWPPLNEVDHARRALLRAIAAREPAAGAPPPSP